MKRDIQSLTLDELTQVVLSLGEKKYRAEQIFHDIMLGKKIEEITTITQDLLFLIRVPSTPQLSAHEVSVSS